jgi:hypothetical protein
MKKLIILIVSVIFLLPLANAQEIAAFNSSRSLKLENESKEQHISIDVSEEYNTLALSIHSNIYEGKLSIEILDPSGEKQGNFSIGCQVGGANNPTTKEVVQGQFRKTFQNPKKGKWVVKIIPQNANAQVNITVTQIQN